MVVKLGINGFGRIGRLVMRAALDNPDATVVACNDPFLTVDYAAYLLKHDSVHGKYDKEITFDDTHIIIGDVKVRFFTERNPAGTSVLESLCLSRVACRRRSIVPADSNSHLRTSLRD
jgi:glyceraldehyde 3-phosphate dehydrogenase